MSVIVGVFAFLQYLRLDFLMRFVVFLFVCNFNYIIIDLQILKFSITDAAGVSSLPFAGQVVAALLFGISVDWLLKNVHFTINCIRKSFTIPSMCFYFIGAKD